MTFLFLSHLTKVYEIYCITHNSLPARVYFRLITSLPPQATFYARDRKCAGNPNPFWARRFVVNLRALSLPPTFWIGARLLVLREFVVTSSANFDRTATFVLAAIVNFPHSLRDLRPSDTRHSLERIKRSFCRLQRVDGSQHMPPAGLTCLYSSTRPLQIARSIARQVSYCECNILDISSVSRS
jgi:hypothetical protein